MCYLHRFAGQAASGGQREQQERVCETLGPEGRAEEEVEGEEERRKHRAVHSWSLRCARHSVSALQVRHPSTTGVGNPRHYIQVSDFALPTRGGASLQLLSCC